MAGQVGNADGDVGFQIAPMVDVVFVLVLFFMASAGMQQAELELGVTLPATSAPSDGTAVVTPIWIEIDSRGQVSVEGQNYDNPASEDMPQLTDFLGTMMQEDNKNPVIIRPNPAARHNRVVAVLNSAAKAKVKTLTFG